MSEIDSILRILMILGLKSEKRADLFTEMRPSALEVTITAAHFEAGKGLQIRSKRGPR
jgi:hypothetical protein